MAIEINISIANLVVKFIDLVYKLLGIVFDVDGIITGITGDASNLKEKPTSVDARIAKLDSARANLVEGLQAIDDLKKQANVNKRELWAAIQDIARLEKNKDQLKAELQSIRTVLESDVSAFRKVAGIPGPEEIRRAKLIGFGSGVLASLVASALYVLIVWLVKKYILSAP